MYAHLHSSQSQLIILTYQKQMNAKTRFCKHQNGCIPDTLRQVLKQVKYGLIISSILQLLKSLRALIKDMASFKKSFTPQYLSIIAFLTASTFALRTVKCSLRWLRNKDDGINSILAGMAAGYIGTLTLNKQYWYVLLMFIGSRIIGAIHQALIQNGYLEANNSKIHEFILFFFANMVHCYGYFIEPDILKPDMYNLYERMSVLTPNEKRWHMASIIYKKRELDQRGVLCFSDFTQKKIQKLHSQIEQLK